MAQGPSYPLARRGRHHETHKETHQPWLWAWGGKVRSNGGQVGWGGGIERLQGTQVPGRVEHSTGLEIPTARPGFSAL